MFDSQDGCDWVHVSFGTGLPFSTSEVTTLWRYTNLFIITIIIIIVPDKRPLNSCHDCVISVYCVTVVMASCLSNSWWPSHLA